MLKSTNMEQLNQDYLASYGRRRACSNASLRYFSDVSKSNVITLLVLFVTKLQVSGYSLYCEPKLDGRG